MTEREELPSVDRPHPVRTHDLYTGLKALQEAQRPMLEKLRHLNRHPDTFARYGNALAIEVAEFVNETPWKVWKKKEPDLDRLGEEFADILAFLGTWLNLLELLGINPMALALEYAAKTEENHARLRGERPYYGTPEGGYGVPKPTDAGPDHYVGIFSRESEPVTVVTDARKLLSPEELRRIGGDHKESAG